MKDLKHTRGQWAVKKWLDGNIDIVIHINEKRMTGIAQVNALKSEEETDANARLISSAPELIETLKKLHMDLWEQIESKYGPEAASKYTSLLQSSQLFEKITGLKL